MKKALILFLGCLLSASLMAATNMDTTSAQDNLFTQLRDAARKENAERAATLASQLRDYPIPSYVAYYRLKANLKNASDSQVQSFLNQYQGTAIADRMRNDWLLLLAEQQNWSAFDKEYPLFQLKDDLQLKCYGLLSSLNKGQNVAQAARELLLTPKKYGKGCMRLITELAEKKQFTADDLWWQARLASEINMTGLAQRMAVLAGASPAEVGRAWKATASVVSKEPGQSRNAQEVYVLAIGQYARKQPAEAAAILERVSGRLSPQVRAYAWASVAYPASIALSPKALSYWEKAGDVHLTPNGYDWRVRMALRAQNWKWVEQWINAMPASQQQEPAWMYWKGRALLARGDRENALKLFEAIAHRKQFYGQLALEELGKPIRIPAQASSVTESELEPMRTNEGFQLAFKFFKMGWRFEGMREWNWQLRGMDDRQLLAAAEFARQNAVLDRMVNTSDRTRAQFNFLQRYPSPYREKMQAMTQQQGLDAAWVYGLIRQESRFVTNARSSAGASGLMQLMPATARLVAKKIGLKDYQQGGINNIDTNMLLGTTYLKMVMNQLGGSETLATAAYNAGPRRPIAWRATLAQPVEGAIFAETIPFSETRDYVKNVMSNATYYAGVFDGGAHSLKQRLKTVSPTD